MRQRATHHLPVPLDAGDVLRVALGLLLLLDARHYAPGGAAGADDVLVGHRQQVALLDRQFRAVAATGRDGGRDLLHLGRHLVVPLRLLGQLGHVDGLLPVDGHGVLSGVCGCVWVGVEEEREKECARLGGRKT